MRTRVVEADLVVVGSGVAGLSAAVGTRSRDPQERVVVVSKTSLSHGATAWAQGGVAAVLGDEQAPVSADPAPQDSVELHLADTLKAGAGLCDIDAVRVLVEEGPARVWDLVDRGAVFDRDARGELELAREGGHSAARVVHAGGAATGAEIQRALVAATRASGAVLMEGCFALDLVVDGDRCVGLTALGPDGEVLQVRARDTLLATGGAGQVFAITTNPPESTGDGVAMALRAGVPVADVEFMQFHPTALHAQASPRPLLSEALRGEGAVLRDASGARFVDELAPRDVVSRAISARMLASGTDHVWLDATGIDDFAGRWPTLMVPLRTVGLDPGRDWLPVAPAAHYLSGGVLTDLDASTARVGLWAAGEAACTGVHGANRLASNSLLEGLVFASRMVEARGRGKVGGSATGALRSILGGDAAGGVGVRRLATDTHEHGRPEAADAPLRSAADWTKARERLQRTMSAGAGVVRDAASLARAAADLDELDATTAGSPPRSVPEAELVNLIAVAAALVRAAAARTESRGTHWRGDHPATSAELGIRFGQ